jgi:hypothetical protein
MTPADLLWIRARDGLPPIDMDPGFEVREMSKHEWKKEKWRSDFLLRLAKVRARRYGLERMR